MKRSVLALLVTAGVIHCGSDNVDVKPTQTRRPDGGVELPPAPPPLPGCDNTLMPTENACVIHESAGIFVSASKGGDDGLGTRDKPLKSVSVAVNAALRDGRRVYVCAETYDAQLTFGDGVNVFGYFDCSATDWKVTDRRAKIAPKEGVAAIAKGIAKPTRIEGLDIEAADGKAPGDSSIGLIAQDSNGLTFLNTRIAAGKGRDGKNGADAVQLTASATADGATSFFETSDKATSDARKQLENRPGGDGTCSGAAGHNGGNGGDGAKGALAACTGLTGVGGACSGSTTGGALGNCWSTNEYPGLPATATAMTAKGGVSRVAPGQPGNAGNAGSDGRVGAPILSADGFFPSAGTSATDGTPGQGGGGGAGFSRSGLCNDPTRWYEVPGAGGGAGGCPGLAGAPGGGGGASIAILAIKSALKIDGRSTITASNAGAGGRAGARSTPTGGGAAGANPAGATYAFAGAGGAGGEAGLSGHGSAGYSIGIAWSGAKPNTEVTPTVGTAGAQAMPRGNEAPGAAGLAKDVYEF